MRSRISRPSPSLVISIIALVVAVGGSTFAFATVDSKHVRKIATRVVKNLSPKLSVLHSASADTATTAGGAPPTGAAGGDLSGSYPNPLIGTAKVTTTKLADSSITTAKLADSSITTAKLANNSVTTAKLADDSVTSAKLADDSVTSAKIQDGQVRAADLGTIITVSNTVTGVLNGENGTATATCPAGTVVISGGGQPTFFGVETTSLLKSGNGWEYQARNNSGFTTSLTAFAYCLSG